MYRVRISPIYFSIFVLILFASVLFNNTILRVPKANAQVAWGPCDADSDGCADDLCCTSGDCANYPPQIDPAGQCCDPGSGVCASPIPDNNCSDGSAMDDVGDPCIHEQDSDYDGCLDNVDVCPYDPALCDNTGECGCNAVDNDQDGIPDCIDPTEKTLLRGERIAELGNIGVYNVDVHHYLANCPDLANQLALQPPQVQVAVLNSPSPCDDGWTIMRDYPPTISIGLPPEQLNQCVLELPALTTFLYNLQTEVPDTANRIMDRLSDQNICDYARAIAHGELPADFPTIFALESMPFLCEVNLEQAEYDAIFMALQSLSIAAGDISSWQNGCELVRSTALLGVLQGNETRLFDTLHNHCKVDIPRSHELVLYSLINNMEIGSIAHDLEQINCENLTPAELVNRINLYPGQKDGGLPCEVTVSNLIRGRNANPQHKLNILRDWSVWQPLYANNTLDLCPLTDDDDESLVDIEDAMKTLIEVAEITRPLYGVYQHLAEDSNNYDIYQIIDGVEQNLTCTPEISERFPAINPWRGLVAYISGDDESGLDLHVARVTSTEDNNCGNNSTLDPLPVQLPEGYSVVPYPPSWSPENKLAITLENAEEQQSIWLLSFERDSESDDASEKLVDNAKEPAFDLPGYTVSYTLVDNTRSEIRLIGMGEHPTDAVIIETENAMPRCSSSRWTDLGRFFFVCEDQNGRSSLYIHSHSVDVIFTGDIQPIRNPAGVPGTEYVTFNNEQAIYYSTQDNTSDEPIELFSLPGDEQYIQWSTNP